MSILNEELKDNLKEQQRINALKKKIEEERTNLDKKQTRQKILLGAFLVDMLEKDAVPTLKNYVADNLGDYLTRKTDKKILNGLVVALGGEPLIEEEEPKTKEKEVEEKTDDVDVNHQSQSQSQSQYN